MLNRGAFVVRPGRGFIEWARTLDDSGLVPDPTEEPTVYLVPVFESDEEAESVLGTVYEEIFESELYSWHTDESAWPKVRTLDMFRDWFVVESHSVVEDLCGYGFEDDEDDDEDERYDDDEDEEPYEGEDDEPYEDDDYDEDDEDDDERRRY